MPITGYVSGSLGLTVPAGWTPAQLPSLLLWLKADAGITFGTGSNVATWADQSRNHNDVSQGTSANQPTFSATGFNGRQGVTFSFTNNTWLGTAATVAIPGPFMASFFVVGRFFSTTTTGGCSISILGSGQSSDTNNNKSIQPLTQLAGPVMHFVYAANANNNIAYAPYDRDLRYGCVTYWDGFNQNFQGYKNGQADLFTQIFNAQSAFGSGSTITVGNDGLHDTPWDGVIAEVIATGDQMLPQNIALLDGYFASRWGLAA